MESSYSNPLIAWVSRKRFSIELILSLLSTVVYLGAITHVLHNDYIVLSTLLTLSGFYFISALFLSIDVPTMGALISSKVVGISSAACIVGITFALIGLLGAKNQLMVGLLPLIPSTIVVVGSAFVKPRKEMIFLAVRGILVSFISLWHFIQPGLK